MKYGNTPIDLGKYDLDVGEMMFYLYLPLKMKGVINMHLPRRLFRFNRILMEARADVGVEKWNQSYIYITAKTMYVDKSAPGNRPG